MPLLHVNSVTLNVVRRGTGPVVLFVHGFPLDHQMWQGQLEGLDRDFTLIVPDLRGFGQSSVGTERISLAQYADDLAGVLDALQITTPVALVGLSMGGYIAWQFWRRHGARLSHLILCDTRAQADTPEVARNRIELATRVLEEGPTLLADSMLEQLFSKYSQRARTELIAATRQVIQSTSPRGVATALHAMAERPDATVWLADIQLPSLLVCGEEDVITPPTEMERMADAMPDARLTTIERCGHMAPLEDPEAVNQAIREFVLTS